MKNFIMAMLIGIWFVSGSLTTYAAAEEGDKKPLNEVFDQIVIVPFDYQNKVFANGQKTDFYQDYQIVQRDGHILVPIRLMSDLATQASQYSSMWEAVWQPQNPNDVLLKNSNLNKIIKFTVNSKTMLVNNLPHAIDIAPQKINGRIVLPLRSAAEALDKKIDWLDGLVLIGDENVDLQNPQTLAIKDRIKAELTDTRKRVDYTQTVYPITKYGNSVYYFKRSYTNNSEIQALYKKADGQKEVQVRIQGNAIFDFANVIDDELYYISMVNNKAELDAFNLAENKSRKICAVEQWRPGDGWLVSIEKIDNELYVNLHSGDLTMGSEALYKVDHGALKSVAGAKSFIRFIKEGDYIYQTDFAPMNGGADNLNRVDTKTGEASSIGEPGFAYGINRKIDDRGISFGTSHAMYIKDGYLYTLGYKESDPKDVSSVYKINLADGTQVKLSSPANEFWMVDNRIYYSDSSTGYLGRVDLNGNNDQILVKRKLMRAQFFNGSLYYTASENTKDSSGLGELYRYDTANGREVKLSDKSVSSYYAGSAGVYYLSNGYDLGLYKIDAAGRNVRLVKDTINSAVLTDEGIVYTMAYKEGIYSAK
ncbi:DUF5050 domain-containing protein [Paenibacillus sepulcri]|uniref:DUF5050 domain-containing protein n=1 Tax=Paenibacillus sepulcri TaxID=359917 RepID=A0ABS7BZ50_9BACL|nr:DUF5050 domain-containing protein [Paenibacillus sepulcri]